ncbi:hypothetical protein JSCD14_01220 [Clostridioides difficile]|nr:hypothetical protein BN163_1950031 [Clostridioides difficile T5]CCK92372.1 hypothetical protein BN164_1820031 [Clostridioides difficile T20]CCK96072.1 hypothetical protein BN165_1850031 [Clostridioides difficile E1]CCL00021.1 hypothetical protein BN166_2370031 [Clostridioides difficile E10]GCA60249.1 hypothetical protein TNHP173_18950 [Clostridioides difficile]
MFNQEEELSILWDKNIDNSKPYFSIYAGVGLRFIYLKECDLNKYYFYVLII